MDLFEAMRTTFAARHYTADPIDDKTLTRILDNARFAPSGGNRQGWRVIVVKDQSIRARLKMMMAPTVQQYIAQVSAGEVPFNAVNPSAVSAATVAATPSRFPLIDHLEEAPAVLVVCVDLAEVTAFDKDLDRVAVVPGASVYPFVWNILLAARGEGFGGVLTTFLANAEAEASSLLDLPDNFAVAAMVCLGKPVKQLTRLKRAPVSHFARTDRWTGEVFGNDPD